MYFGMPNLVELTGIDGCISTAEELGLDFVEINMSFPDYQPCALDIPALRRRVERGGLFFTIHADEQLNPFDFNPLVSECYFEVMRQTLRTALELGAPLINMHLQRGVYVTLPERVILLTDVYRDAYLSRVKEFIAMCEEEIGDKDVTVAIENVDSNPFTSSQRDALGLFMASPVFGLTLDVGHDARLRGADRDVYENYRDRVSHMHLHDCRGGSPHLPLGEGDVDIHGMLSLPLNRQTCLVEVKTLDGLRCSLEYLEKHGYR